MFLVNKKEAWELERCRGLKSDFSSVCFSTMIGNGGLA